MTNTIELGTSFEEYVVNELVNKLHELQPEDYDINSVQSDEDLLYLLLDDEYANGYYYIYTEDSDKVFKAYFSDILYICNRAKHEDGETVELEANKMLLQAIKYAFKSLLEKAATPIKFTRAGLDEIANTLVTLFNY